MEHYICQISFIIHFVYVKRIIDLIVSSIGSNIELHNHNTVHKIYYLKKRDTYIMFRISALFLKCLFLASLNYIRCFPPQATGYARSGAVWSKWNEQVPKKANPHGGPEYPVLPDCGRKRCHSLRWKSSKMICVILPTTSASLRNASHKYQNLWYPNYRLNHSSFILTSNISVNETFSSLYRVLLSPMNSFKKKKKSFSVNCATYCKTNQSWVALRSEHCHNVVSLPQYKIRSECEGI